MFVWFMSFWNFYCFMFVSFWDVVNVYGVDVEGDLLIIGIFVSCFFVIDMISNDLVFRGVKVSNEFF